MFDLYSSYIIRSATKVCVTTNKTSIFWMGHVRDWDGLAPPLVVVGVVVVFGVVVVVVVVGVVVVVVGVVVGARKDAQKWKGTAEGYPSMLDFDFNQNR